MIVAECVDQLQLERLFHSVVDALNKRDGSVAPGRPAHDDPGCD
jgi:hypothetical protein